MSKILVIDDDPTTRTMVSFILKNNGYQSQVAEDGVAGLALVKKEEFDLIVLDVAMPQMDGFTFLSELKQMKGAQIPPVIMLTSKEHMEHVFMMEGVYKYFLKPLNSDQFVTAIKEKLV